MEIILHPESSFFPAQLSPWEHYNATRAVCLMSGPCTGFALAEVNGKWYHNAVYDGFSFTPVFEYVTYGMLDSSDISNQAYEKLYAWIQDEFRPVTKPQFNFFGL